MGQPSPLVVETHDLGDYVQFRATFTGTDLVTPQDPSSICFLLKDALGNTGTYFFGSANASIVRSGTGLYFTERVVYPSGGSGEWRFGWMATGGVIAYKEHRFVAERSFIL
jgi:hypothetical protein